MFYWLSIATVYGIIILTIAQFHMVVSGGVIGHGLISTLEPPFKLRHPPLHTVYIGEGCTCFIAALHFP